MFAGVFIGVYMTDSNPPTPPPKKSKAELRAELKKEKDFQRVAAALKVLKSSAKNPDSYSLESIILTDKGTICVVYRARNSFNAIVPGHSYIRKNNAFHAGTEEGFATKWNKYCGGVEGQNMLYARQAL